jgi:hypothetical protein
MDRRELARLKKQLREQFQIEEFKAQKAGVDAPTRSRIRQDALKQLDQLDLDYGDDLQKLNSGGSINMGDATISRGLDQTKLQDMAQVTNLGKTGMFSNIRSRINNIPKGVKSVIPGLGVATAALSGDPAMATEELAQDVMGPAGIAYEAIRPDVAGNPEEEQMMLAERNAMENYKNSQASKDSKFAKIRSLLSK